jgi:hypothetical protein
MATSKTKWVSMNLHECIPNSIKQIRQPNQLFAVPESPLRTETKTNTVREERRQERQYKRKSGFVGRILSRTSLTLGIKKPKPTLTILIVAISVTNPGFLCTLISGMLYGLGACNPSSVAPNCRVLSQKHKQTINHGVFANTSAYSSATYCAHLGLDTPKCRWRNLFGR